MARTKVYYRLRKEYNSTEGEELKQDNKIVYVRNIKTRFRILL